MKTLGYYNGKYDELDKMTIPFNDRVCFLELGCMMQAHQEIISFLQLMSI